MNSNFKYIIIIVSILLLLVGFIFFQIQAFGINKLEYHISNTGDATVIANYELTFVEKIWLMFPIMKFSIIDAIKTEYGEDSDIIIITDTSTIFTIPKFADRHDTYMQTPMLTFENIKKRTNDYWFIQYLNIDYSPKLTIIKFYDGTEYKYSDAMSIPALTFKF